MSGMKIENDPICLEIRKQAESRYNFGVLSILNVRDCFWYYCGSTVYELGYS